MWGRPDGWQPHASAHRTVCTPYAGYSSSMSLIAFVCSWTPWLTSRLVDITKWCIRCTMHAVDCRGHWHVGAAVWHTSSQQGNGKRRKEKPSCALGENRIWSCGQNSRMQQKLGTAKNFFIATSPYMQSGHLASLTGSRLGTKASKRTVYD